jgi:hypothetical protein
MGRGTWHDIDFKAYNFKALGHPTDGGYLHPLLKVMVVQSMHSKHCSG